jgi:hypothetical protein
MLNANAMPAIASDCSDPLVDVRRVLVDRVNALSMIDDVITIIQRDKQLGDLRVAGSTPFKAWLKHATLPSNNITLVGF